MRNTYLDRVLKLNETIFISLTFLSVKGAFFCSNREIQKQKRFCFCHQIRSNETILRFQVLTTNWRTTLCDYVRATLNWKVTKKVHFPSLCQYFVKLWMINLDISFSSFSTLYVSVSQPFLVPCTLTEL